MNKVRRVFDIAKELNISHIEIIEFLAKKNIKATLMSVIDNASYSDILENFQQEKTQVDRLRKEKARLNVIHHNQEQENKQKKNSDKKVLICDTNLQVIKIWSEVKYSKCDSFIIKNKLIDEV